MGFILHGLDTEKYDRTYGDRELIRRIIGYFKPQWKRMLLVASMVLLNSGFNTIRPVESHKVVPVKVSLSRTGQGVGRQHLAPGRGRER